MRRVQLEKYMHETGCSTCHGHRLNKQASSYLVTSTSLPGASTKEPASLSLPQVCSLSVVDAWDFFGELVLDETGRFIATEVLKEIRGRLGFLLRCGLDYLTLDRTAPTLSGARASGFGSPGRSVAGWSGSSTFSTSRPSVCIHATTRCCSTVSKTCARSGQHRHRGRTR